MKKSIVAAAIGLSLLAGQAIAQNNATVRVADRIGAPAGEASEFAGASAGLIFAAATIAGFLILSEATSDDSESD
jgi:phage-related minor tail protein